MNDEDPNWAEPLMVVAHALKTKGLKGELIAELLTDFPDRFADVSRLIAVAPNGTRRSVGLERYALHNARVVLKLAGYDTIESVSELVGYDFAVTESERVQLPEGHFYDWELEGCFVETAAARQIGFVREVMRARGAVEMLVVENDEQHQYLIPMVESIVVEIDIRRRRIQIDPPEGLLEL
jgi:16S rRNA processing protein RimM